MIKIKLVFIFLLHFVVGYSQKEANNWYFGDFVGLSFNGGEPSILDGILKSHGAAATMSDSLGNFLFSTNGEVIYNKNKTVMLNGDGLKGSFFASQGSIIVPKPGSDKLFYVFYLTFAQDAPAYFGLYYSVIDMNLDGGLGGVTTEKNILLGDAWDAVDKVLALRHENNKDIWIISYKNEDPGYAAYLITENGINQQAIISLTGIEREHTYIRGQMKVSYNKKYLVNAFAGYGIGQRLPEFEICNFNDLTGEINLKYTISFFNEDGSNTSSPRGIEFSPDSKFLYLSVFYTNPRRVECYQLDMKYIEDSVAFSNSRSKVAEGPSMGLQLATDGKIYCTVDSTENYYDYISVINYPWKIGVDCAYESDILYLGKDAVGYYLQNILLDYLFRFEWEGKCSAEPFKFQSNFQPEPAYIRWSFSDPAAGADSISLELNPVHYFTHGGEFEVKVFVQYPNGRIEETSRVVTVIESPHPDLGPDTLKCEIGSITLNAGDDEGMFVWSNGTFGNNARQITVSDTGWYWVQVTNSEGCAVRDSIYVGLYPKAAIDDNYLQLIPTTCGGSNGKILGLTISGTEPLSFRWYDAADNLLGTELDLTGLSVGNYFLHILDGNGCETISEAYTIEDAGDIEISAVEKEDAHCGQNIGSISITALSGDPDNLLYSIDNGTSWQTGNSLFENLASGNYFIRVKDLSGCESVYAGNPVLVDNIPGPNVTAVSTTPEIDYLQNGEIELTATVSSGNLYYSIDGGTSFQTNNGLFSNLSAGNYFCEVKDDFGCDTTFTVEVKRTISQLIEAIAGDGYTCIGNAAVVPLKLDNFKDIYKFYVTLTYDTTILTCDGYINVNPMLESSLQASILPGTDEVIVSWQGETPVTLEENALMLELVFGAKQQGISGIDWAALPDKSAFYNENLEEVSADYHVGMLRVYTRPTILMGSQRNACQGDKVLLLGLVDGGTGDISYFWTGPNDFESHNEVIALDPVELQQAGNYTLTVTDTINCTESKTINVVVYASPQAAFAGQDTIFAQPGFVLDAGSGFESYLWNTGDTTETITINLEGEYSVEIQSQEKCTAADTVTVLWGGEPFYLPNAFSPDGDGLNDEFKPVERYDMVRSYHLSIFNRWGQLIFETSDISRGWDGTYQNSPVQAGTYICKISYTAYPDYSIQQTKTGSVVVVR